MTLRIWLHEGHDGETGLIAFASDVLGFATWAEDEAALLAKLRPKFAEHARWRAAHGLPLVSDLGTAPQSALDWDPPYRRFASWADWRTIRAILAHVANGETHYYARNVGHAPVSPPADPRGDWRTFLPRSRAETIRFLASLARASDRARVRAVDHGFGEEWWSVRKALRRLVAHERCHGKSIRRILAAHRASQDGGAR